MVEDDMLDHIRDNISEDDMLDDVEIILVVKNRS